MYDYNIPEMVDLREWAGSSDQFDLRFWASRGSSGLSSCGTTLCLAGRAVSKAGYVFIWDGPEKRQAFHCQLGLGPAVSIPLVARGILGLGIIEAEQIFHPDLTDEAMVAIGTRDTMRVDTSEADSLCALAFLDHLIVRAKWDAAQTDPRRRRGHMSKNEIAEWRNQWATDHEQVLLDSEVDI